MVNVLVPLVFSLALSAAAEGPSSRPASRAPTLKTFVYRTTPEAKLELHVHLPPDVRKGDRRPAIVFFFGGGWKSGTVNQFERQAEHLAQRGMVAARADYRVFDRHQVAPDACVDDAFHAIRWLRAHADELGIDPKRIAASGGSAGGHLAACTALCEPPRGTGAGSDVPAKANALVLFNPVLNMEHPRIVERLGGDESLARKISPYHQLRKGAPPTLILFGTDDRLIAQAPPYLRKARELGNDVELFTAEGQDHGFFNNSPWYERTLQKVDDFLVRIDYLEPTTTKPTH